MEGNVVVIYLLKNIYNLSQLQEVNFDSVLLFVYCEYFEFAGVLKLVITSLKTSKKLHIRRVFLHEFVDFSSHAVSGEDPVLRVGNNAPHVVVLFMDAMGPQLLHLLRYLALNIQNCSVITA